MLSFLSRDPMPMSRWEAVLTRLLLAWLLWQGLPSPATPPWTEQPHPAALGQFLDFTFLSQPEVFATLRSASQAGIILFAVGLLPVAGLAAFLVLDISLHTLATSQGFQGHAAQLNALLILAIVTGYLCHAFARRGRLRTLLIPGAQGDHAAIHAARLMLAATYVVSAFSKLTRGGWDWSLRGESFALQMLKAQDEMRFTHIVPELTSSAVAAGELIVAHPGYVSVFLTAALLMELFAFLACTGRVPALILGIGLLLFHKTNQWLMGLSFVGNQWALIILFIQPFYWLSLALRFLPGMKKAAPGPAATISPFWHPAIISILMSFFLLFRGEWYPFSPFPMYSVLPKATTAFYATDLDGRPIPLMQLGTNAPTFKKSLSTEMRVYRDSGEVTRNADFTPEHWRVAADLVIARMMELADHPIRQHQGLRFYRKDYRAVKGRVKIETTQITEIPPPGA